MSIITIFSALYCHGDKVADEVARTIGYKRIDGEVLEWASRTFKTPRQRLVRAMHGGISILDRFIGERHRNVAYLNAAIAENVKQDNVVYHGFAGHLLPREVTHVLRTCIVGNRDFRADVATKTEGISKREAIRNIKRHNEECRKWTRYLFNVGPWDKRLYDIKIPMHESSIEDAVKLICDNAQKKPLLTTPESRKALNDFALSARVNVVLVENGHDVSLLSDDGEVTIIVKRNALRWDHLKKELQRIAEGVPGVKGVDVRLAPGFTADEIKSGTDSDAASTVLLVDDEKEFVQTLSERLQMRDLSTAVVYNGEEALSYLKYDDPEVMILDLRMPGIDGTEVLRRVKKNRPEIEVIILTGHGTEKDQALTLELGAFAYLEKPVEIDELARTVRAAYEKIRKKKRT